MMGEDHLHKDFKVCDCVLYSKPRCVYANEKLSGNVKTNVDCLVADGKYPCGGSFVDNASCRYSVVARRQLTCAS